MEQTLEQEIAEWDALFPDGRQVFYEGDDPEGFAATMAAVDIDVDGDGWCESDGWTFFIPAGRVGEIYGTGRYGLGS